MNGLRCFRRTRESLDCSILRWASTTIRDAFSHWGSKPNSDSTLLLVQRRLEHPLAFRHFSLVAFRVNPHGVPGLPGFRELLEQVEIITMRAEKEVARQLLQQCEGLAVIIGDAG